MPQLENPSLEDFPEFAAARAKLHKLRDELNAAGLRRDTIKGQIADAGRAVKKRVEATSVPNRSSRIPEGACHLQPTGDG